MSQASGMTTGAIALEIQHLVADPYERLSNKEIAKRCLQKFGVKATIERRPAKTQGHGIGLMGLMNAAAMRGRAQRRTEAKP